VETVHSLITKHNNLTIFHFTAIHIVTHFLRAAMAFGEDDDKKKHRKIVHVIQLGENVYLGASSHVVTYTTNSSVFRTCEKGEQRVWGTEVPCGVHGGKPQ